ncbi:MAG: hypothetical protein LUE23_02890 [Lachnospiraceae bacterium]|nr:hypothetical protein [Lachnospiraceae bacterium]
MSCHNIGRGLNTVTRKSIELLDAGKITWDVAKELIRTARDGVNWCDGNDYEAVAYILQNRCGYCLEEIKPGKPMYNLWDIDLDYNEELRLFRETRDSVVASYLCPECFDSVIREFMHDDTAGEAKRRYIEENIEEDKRVALEVPSGPYWNNM